MVFWNVAGLKNKDKGFGRERMGYYVVNGDMGG